MSNPNPIPPTQPQLQTAFDSSIWYILSLWPALHVATQNNWGGPSSSDKKDWFAGAISDLFTSNPSTDFDDLCIFLLQIMQDEFETFVEDDTEEEIARSILDVSKKLFEDGDLEAATLVEKRWKQRGQMKVDVQVVDGEVEGEWDDDEDEDGDVQMGDDDFAPELVQAAHEAAGKERKAKGEPEVDDEGFTKVVGKKKR